MRQSLKVAISLLVAIVLFAGFTVLAFSGLFDVLQASFFLPRVEQGYERQLAVVGDRIEKYHVANLERFATLAKKDFVAASFATNLPAAVMQQWADALAALKVSAARVLAPDGQRIVFSSLASDAKDQGAGRFAFRNYAEVEQAVPASSILLGAGDQPRLFIDGKQGRFLYLVPVYQPSTGGGRCHLQGHRRLLRGFPGPASGPAASAAGACYQRDPHPKRRSSSQFHVGRPSARCRRP